jgi:hypothetical protein
MKIINFSPEPFKKENSQKPKKETEAGIVKLSLNKGDAEDISANSLIYKLEQMGPYIKEYKKDIYLNYLAQLQEQNFEELVALLDAFSVEDMQQRPSYARALFEALHQKVGRSSDEEESPKESSPLKLHRNEE